MAFEVRVTDNGTIVAESPLGGLEVLSLTGYRGRGPVVAWRVNRILRSLDWSLDGDSEVEFVDAGSFEGMEVYRRTLSFLLVLACKRAVGRDVLVRHSMNDGYYCELSGGDADPETVARIRSGIQDLIDRNLPIRREVLSVDKAIRIFERQGNADKARLLRWTSIDPVVA